MSQRWRPVEAKRSFRKLKKSMSKSSLALMLTSLMGVLFTLPSIVNAQDLWQSTIERMQNGLDLLVGDGVFDSADEDICLNALGNSAYQKQEVMIGAVEGELSDVSARIRLGTLTISAIDDRMLSLHLRDVVEDRREVPAFERLSTEETERLSLACSVIVKGLLEDSSAEVVLKARTRAERWVLSELTAAFEERLSR